MIAINVLFCFCVISIDLSVSNGVKVLTTSGLVRGKTLNVLNKNINQFLNIPYAEPPLGELRFAKPESLRTPIKGVIDGTKPGNSCIQNAELQQVINPLGKDNLTISEDCLVLNIWSPTNDTSKLKPVMFWIYGGGLTSGSIFVSLYDGSVLATNDVVIVSVNYRVGPLGFLYGCEESAPGNVGLFDQRLALLWVRENIHLFGGDKNQITLFGESAGSWSISAHLISPLSKGLFKRAIMQSGSILFNRERPPISKEEALINAHLMAVGMNCPINNQWLQCLRRVDAKKFIPLIPVTFPIFGTEFLPIYTEKALKQQNFNKNIEILAGINQDEGTIGLTLLPGINNRTVTKLDFISFVNLTNNTYHNIKNIKSVTDFYLKDCIKCESSYILQKMIDFFGDVGLKCPTYLFLKRYVQHSNQNNYFYYLTYVEYPYPKMGVYHTADIPLVFGTAFVDPKSSNENKVFSQQVMCYWTDFAKYGKPKNWKKFIKSGLISGTAQNSYNIKELNPNSNKYLHHLFDKTCDGFWSDYF